MTSRSIYAEPRIWKPLMERVISDFIPAINKTYLQLNRLLAQRRILPEIGAVLRRAKRFATCRRWAPPAAVRPLINDIHPSLQAWRTLDLSAAAAATTASLRCRPTPTRRQRRACRSPAETERLLSPAKRDDGFRHPVVGDGNARPLAAQRSAGRVLRTNPPTDSIPTTPVNRIPWIHAAIAPKSPRRATAASCDVGFLFDYLFHDPSIPPRFRKIFEDLQMPFSRRHCWIRHVHRQGKPGAATPRRAGRRGHLRRE
jgi:hypothetical protein